MVLCIGVKFLSYLTENSILVQQLAENNIVRELASAMIKCKVVDFSVVTHYKVKLRIHVNSVINIRVP